MGELMDRVRELWALQEQRRRAVALELFGVPTTELEQRVARLEAHRRECCARELDCDAVGELDDLRWVIDHRVTNVGRCPGAPVARPE